MEENLEIGIKENPYFFPYFSIPLPKRNQYLYMNNKNPEEEKNDRSISFSFGEKKKSDENNLNINNEDSYFKSIEATTQNDNSSNNNIERKETPQFKKNINEKKDILDDINLRINYDQIEKELNKFNNKKDNGIERNENDIIKNKNNYNKINSNTQMKKELFNCSDNEEFLNKKIISNNEKIRMLQNQIRKLGQNNIINYNINRNSIGKNYNTYKDNNKNFIHDERSDKNNMDQKLFEKIEYGIDENGNPISLKEYKEEISKKKNTPKIIAYIILSKEKDKNYLIDLKGNIIPKMEDGDFNCKYGNIIINIKNFDVQNPKLRVYGCRQKFTSIFSEEESESQNSVRPNLLSEIKSRFLLSKLKDNIIMKNRNSVFLNRLNKSEKSLLNKCKKQQFKSGINQYNQKTEKKRIYHYHYNKIKNKNKKDDIHHKISKNKNYKDIFNMSHKSNDSFRKTNALLNSKIRHSHNNFIYNCLNNISNNRQDYRYSTRKNRTPSPTQQEFISASRRIKNKEKEKDTQKKENNCKNDNNFINLNIININNKDNPLINKNRRSILKNSSSNALINNNFNKKIQPVLRKSQSTSNNITITLNSISNNIKKIESNIHNTIKKIIDKNMSNSYKYRNQIKNDLPDTSTNSKRGSVNEYSYFFNKNKNKFYENKFEFDDHKNEIDKINFRRILLNRKCKISTSPKNFKCSILSKDANEIITDYTNRSVSKKSINKDSTRKINEFRKNNENKNEYKIKSYLDRNENNKMMFKFNRSNKYINNSYNNNKKNEKENNYSHLRNDNLMKNKSETNINNFTFSFQRNTFLNKSIKKEILLLTNRDNNKKIINKNGFSFNDFSKQKIKSNSECRIFNVKNKIVKSRISPNIRNKMLFYHK